jgi:hypothetical protein
VLVVFQDYLLGKKKSTLFARKEEINPMVNRRYVVVADPVAASFQQAHTHHLFNIVIESWCYSLIVVAN